MNRGDKKAVRMKWLLVFIPVIMLLALTPAYPTLYSQASQALAIRTGTSPFPTLPFTTTRPPNGLARIMGSVVIGPTCPVQNAERPCPVPDYSALVLELTSQEIGQVSVRLADDGSYDATLPAGTYTINLAPCGYVGCAAVFPRVVTVEAGTVTTENFSIDTGIR